MRYLLDTHTLIWTILESWKLSPNARQVIESPENELYISVISFWEISLKAGLGKLELRGITPDEIPQFCQKMGFKILNLDAGACSTYHRLPVTEHKDPFDRMLIWQSLQLKLPIISDDKSMKLYLPEGLQVIW